MDIHKYIYIYIKLDNTNFKKNYENNICGVLIIMKTYYSANVLNAIITPIDIDKEKEYFQVIIYLKHLKIVRIRYFLEGMIRVENKFSLWRMI